MRSHTSIREHVDDLYDDNITHSTLTSYSMGCEPYLLYSRVHAPPYDERFVGYGKNRVSFHYEMAARGTHMRVVPGLFVYHQRNSSQARAQHCKLTTCHRYGQIIRSTDTINLSKAVIRNSSNDLAISVATSAYERPVQMEGAIHEDRGARANWLVGESCWHSFARRINVTYGFYATSSTQEWLDRNMVHLVKLVPSLRWKSSANEPVCASVQVGTCVGSCRPPAVMLTSHVQQTGHPQGDRYLRQLVTSAAVISHSNATPVTVAPARCSSTPINPAFAAPELTSLTTLLEVSAKAPYPHV